MRRAVGMGGALWVLLAASAASAQGRPRLQLLVPPGDSLGLVGPQVRATGVLGANAIRELLDHGFPARLTYYVELWSTAGVFDRRLQAVTWDVVLRFDPVHRLYEGVRVVNDDVRPLGTFERLADAVLAIEQPERAPMRGAPDERAPLYYTATLTLEMLSVSDLAELERWVRGDLNPAVRGRRNPGTALSRGARTLLSRLLGGERRVIETRSEVFRVRRGSG
ncbi:MAG: hypothetical protein JNJ98_13730 [Gemmatimonadetes bacterium]|nr:hypothetical protein [Gemmatimonadota bacterium]